MKDTRLRALVALLAVVIGVGVTVSVVDDDGPGPHRGGTITITARNAQGEAVKVAAPQAQVDNVEGSDAGHHEQGDVESAAADRSSDHANPAAPRIAGPVPLASPQQAGCLTRQIHANWSYRNGTRPSLIVLHFTVSPNVGGWGDVNSIVAFFDRPATSASSNYAIDNEGHCVYMVPESSKAWAQAGFNSATACSIEVVNTGSEATYVGPAGGAGERQLGRIVHDCASRWNIPLRRGATSGCAVTRSGVVDHQTLGGCGGGHFDVGKFRGTAIDRAVARARGAVKPISAGQRKRCTELNTLRRGSLAYHHAHNLPGGHPLTTRQRARAAAIRKGFHAHGLTCTVGVPGKRGTLARR